MNSLFRQPHLANVTHPVKARDVSSNVGTLSYASPAVKIAVACMLQMRGGTRVVLDEGASYPIDGVMYTSDDRVAVDDLVEPTTPQGMAGLKFVITSVMFKYDVNGAVRHLQCSLTRSQKL